MKARDPITLTGLFLAGVVIALGTLWAFERGGSDFRVFYEAWKLVLEGHGSRIYAVSPDRYLYAPGFAWLLAPMALVPTSVSLAIWCFAKAAVLGLVIRRLAVALGGGSRALACAAWALVLVARPFLIDFEYGQVNTFILAACTLALFAHFDRECGPKQAGALWAVLGFAAFAKLFPLPLLLLPWVPGWTTPSRKLWAERAASLAAIAIVVLIPVVTEGLQPGLHLFFGWRDALIARGLPLESHNQSFAALLRHYFTGEATPVIAQAFHPLILGLNWITPSQASLLSIGWTFVISGFFLSWLLTAPSRAPVVWIAVAIGLLILPSHLVWKPYFVMSLPLAALVLRDARENATTLALVFVGMNLTGFDFAGLQWAARFEAASIMLLMHLVLLKLVLRRR